MSFKSGDILIRRRSKAKNLKAKVFKVIGTTIPSQLYSYGKDYQVIDAYGTQHKMSTWDLVAAEEVVSTMRMEANALEIRATILRNEATNLEKELTTVDKFFPKI